MPQDAVPAGWLPAALNQGHSYRDRVRPEDLAALATLPLVSAFYAHRYHHSDRALWCERLAAGEILCNGLQLRADGPLAPGDRLLWHRPPWQEAAVPALPGPLFDDGDLLVLNKPSGLPVLPAGGFLAHTVLQQLEQRHAADPGGLPRPVHRLGRCTTGLLVCARRPASRAWLSARLRDHSLCDTSFRGGETGCRKVYRALTAPLPAPPPLGEPLVIHTPIGRRPHPLLGQIWAAAGPADPHALAARSCLTLLERRPGADLVAVAIASGRPHQIRIHAASLGAPLLGDPLYRPGGAVEPQVLPGAGGYLLHAHQLQLQRPDGSWLELEAPLPPPLRHPVDSPV